MYSVRAVKGRPTATGQRPSTVERIRHLGGRTPARAAALMYHRVTDDSEDADDLRLRVPTFRDHLAYLRDSCVVLPLDELVARAMDGSLKERSVALTFDDGYLDALHTVSPLLETMGLPATFFVNGPWVAATELPWSRLDWIFLSGVPIPPVLDLYGDGAWRQPTASTAERRRAHRLLTEELYPLGNEARDDVLRRLAMWSGIDPSARHSHRLMMEDELLQLARRPGMAIGGHTTHHLALRYQPADVKRSEIAGNRTALERLLGRPVRCFSYPYGDYDRECVRAVQDADYMTAVTVEGHALTIGVRPLLVPRLEIRECPSEDLACRLNQAVGLSAT
jgi:peptidoglycan/xylan/chitin deacetylase (PgdA/CDA1 family)